MDEARCSRARESRSRGLADARSHANANYETETEDVNVGSHEIPVGSANESFSRDRWSARVTRANHLEETSRVLESRERVSVAACVPRRIARARHQSAIRRNSRDRFSSIPYCHIAFALGRVAALTRGKSHQRAREGDL